MSVRRIVIITALFILISSSLSAESLWAPVCRPIFIDLRPSQVGDLVTVLIVEQSTSSQTASADFDKSIDHSNGAGMGPFLKFIPELAYSSDQTSATSGKTTVANKIVTTLTARVTRVLPNGSLEIAAERSINLNGEKQKIILTGLVRPQDISPDNTVLSTSIADAKIDTVGKGPVGDRQREGFISKLLKFLF